MISTQALIEKFEQALADEWGYIWGAAGVMWTAAKQKQKVNYMITNYGSGWKTDSAAKKDKYYGSAYYGDKWINHYVADCSGLFVWAFKLLGGAIAHGSNSIFDRYCSSKGKLSGGARTDGKGLLPGTAVFTGTDSQKPHIGLYVGGNRVIEASGAKVGVIESKITDSKWKYWGELKGVDYSGVEPGPGPDPEPAKKPTIKRGSDGVYVVECQEDLIRLGYNVGKTGADGKFGANTESAVKAFQKDHDGPDGRALKVDGIVGQATWWALDAAVGPEPGPSPEPKKYSVLISGLDYTQAQEIASKYPGSEIVEEVG